MKVEWCERDKVLKFRCPGCECVHLIFVNGQRNTVSATWSWNSSFDKPTFSPSILRSEGVRCHSFVTDGRIMFLTDCAHKLAGHTVDLLDWSDA